MTLRVTGIQRKNGTKGRRETILDDETGRGELIEQAAIRRHVLSCGRAAANLSVRSSIFREGIFFHCLLCLL